MLPGHLLVQILLAHPTEDSEKDPKYAGRIMYPICPKNALVSGAKWIDKVLNE